MYLAHDLRHGRDVAIKVLREELAASVGAERFLAEIKTTAGLTHPHILPLHDSGEADGFLYYVMPFVDGETLRERLDRQKQLPLDEALRIVREVGDGLAYAHARGVVHRDIKPENIFLHSGHALIADFGIARAVTKEETRLTSAGFALGTPAYMSPEQAAGESDIDARADQYALACVLYEMLAGEAAFNGPTIESILVQRFTQPPPRVRSRRAEVGRTLETAIVTAMARDPEKRFETISGFVSRLGGDVMPSTTSADQSVAVLPFANMSGDAGNEYFSDGISEEIINALAQLDGLRVAARTSAFSYKRRNVDLRTIGDELGVSTILEGSVRKSGSRIRITAQLINVADGCHLWSERYDRELTDVFAIQDEIASAIAAKLDVTLHAADGGKFVKPPTDDVAAYDAYLKGRALMHQRGSALFAAVASFEQAIALDSGFAAAHAHLGEALLLMSVWGLVPASAVSARAGDAIDRALACDPESPLAHVALGMRCYWDFDRAGADAAWTRALELDPADADARAFYSLYNLSYMRGQHADAITMLQAAVDADPRSAHLRALLSIMLSWSGQFDLAAEEARRGIALAPDAFFVNWALLLALSEIPGAESVEFGFRTLEMLGRHPWIMMGTALCCAASGRHELAEALRDELDARSRTTYVQPVVRAITAMAAGRDDQLFSLLAVAVSERDPLIALLIGHAPMLRAHRDKPEFKHVLELMGWAEPMPRADVSAVRA